MAMAEISVVPVGTGVGVSRFVAEALRALEAAGIPHTLTPMGTVVEGPVERILTAVRIVHESPFSQGAVRVLTRVTIDDRRDREATAAGKVRSVEEKLGRQGAG